jgi:predicted glycosyltransferase
MTENSQNPPKNLSEDQIKEATAIIAAGATMNTAARAIGMKPDQFRSAVLADPELTHKVRKAEQQAELFYIAKVREATQKPNGWRAAAWWLERRLPDVFGFTKPEQITKDKLEMFMKQIVELIIEYVHDKSDQKELFQRLEILLQQQ